MSALRVALIVDLPALREALVALCEQVCVDEGWVLETLIASRREAAQVFAERKPHVLLLALNPDDDAAILGGLAGDPPVPGIVVLPEGCAASLRRPCLDGGAVDVLCADQLDAAGMGHVLRHAFSRYRLQQTQTVRLGAYNRLQADLEAMESVLRDVADGLLVIASDGEVLLANTAAAQILGIPQVDLIGRPAPAGMLAISRDRVSFVDQFGFSHDLAVRARQTTWKGQPAQVLLLQDITERRANERQLDLLGRAIDAASEGIVVADNLRPDMPIIYVNAAFEEISGYSAIEVIGRNCRFLNRGDNDQAGLHNLRLALQEQRRCTVVLRNYRKDGSLFWNRLNISPVKDKSGAVTHIIGTQSDVTAQIALEEERTRLLSHDALTGLPNFVASQSRLEALVQRALADNTRLSLMYIDLDDFNAVNDAVGFVNGDAALKVVAERLRSAAGESAEIIRYAGDEFLVAIPRVDAALSPLTTAQRLCECIAQAITLNREATVYLSASAGVSVLPDTGYTSAELVRQADVALKRAKAIGRGSAVLFDKEMRNAREDGLMLGGRMRDAIAGGQFVLHYLAIVDAQSNAIVAVEALIRWNSPEFGMLPPLRFIPIAENNGLIVQLGHWVLREACRQLQAWRKVGVDQVTVCVNVSAVQLQREGFVDELARTIREFEVDPVNLELELTETMLIEHSEQIETRLHAIRRMGVRLVLDDFGMGFSSLSYLHRFPLDKLKIDQSFVRDITSNSSHATLARAIIGMGHQLGLKVVAEGIETIAQYSYLKRNNCDEFQGFLFARAVDANDMEKLLRKRVLQPALEEGRPQLDPSERTLLLVDDEVNILRALQRLFRRDGYRILTASNAEEGLDLLASQPVHVVISDQRMPGLDGTEFLGKVKLMYPQTVRMVLSGYTDISTVIDAVNEGAIYKFITKPWEGEQLRQVVIDAFRVYEERLQERAEH